MDFKKVANSNYEDVGTFTTRTYNRHGLGRALSRIKKRVNRAAKRRVENIDLQEQLDPESF